MQQLTFLIARRPFKFGKLRWQPKPKKLKVQAASSWNELTEKQLKRVAKLLFSDKSYHSYLIRQMMVMTGLKRRHVISFTPEQLTQLNHLFDFLLEENNLTRQLIPSFSIGLLRRKLYGPGDGLASVNANEFMEADDYYMEFEKTKDIKQIDKLIACLYRPKNKEVNVKSEAFAGDVRLPFNPYTVERRAKKIAWLDSSTKLGILLWYKGCRGAWEAFFDKIFSGETQESVLNYGWPETIIKLSGDTFGDLEATGKQPMFNILLKMQIDMKDYEEMQRKQDSQRQ
jgi:hypothetical protein